MHTNREGGQEACYGGLERKHTGVETDVDRSTYQVWTALQSRQCIHLPQGHLET